MNKRLEIYKNFIDGLVKIRKCMLVNRIMERGWPKLPENDKINNLLSELTSEQKIILSEIVQNARDGGIHDVLAYLNDEINLKGLSITKYGVDIAIEPFGTQLNYDWVCRREGDEWPENQLENEYLD